jgi:hypothetical protein
MMAQLNAYAHHQGVITLMVQLFYAWRIHVLTRNWFLVVVVVSLSIISAGRLIRHRPLVTPPDRLPVFAMVSTWDTIVKVPQYIKIQEAKVSGYLS